jgi:MHS family proline/betaine transporter-like MFS transporter
MSTAASWGWRIPFLLGLLVGIAGYFLRRHVMETVHGRPAPGVIAAGLLSDWFGRKPLLIIACVLGFVGALPLFWLLNHPSSLLAQLGQPGFVLIIGLYNGTLPAALVEAAPPQVRCTAVSLGYNISFGVIGGLTPLVAAWLVERRGDEIAPTFLIMASVAVTTVTLTRFRETYRAPPAGVTSNAAPAYT